MADRWAEVREIENQIVALFVEHDRGLFLPWRMRRRRQIRGEIRELLVRLDEAAARVPARRHRGFPSGAAVGKD